MRRARRNGLIVLSVVAVLVALYCAAGFLVAPWFINDALVKAAEAAGLDLRVDDMRVNPFLLKVSLVNAQLTTKKDGKPVADAPLVAVDVAWSSAWRRMWVVQRASIRQPTIALAIDEHGGLVLPSKPSESPQATKNPPRITVQEINIDGGRVLVAGRPNPGIQDLNATLKDFSTEEKTKSPFELRARSGEGTLGLRGMLAVRPVDADLQLEASRLPVALAQPWISVFAPLKVASGTLSARGRVRWSEQGGGYEGNASVAALRVLQEGVERPLLAWTELDVAQIRLGFGPLTAQLGEAALKAPALRVEIEPDGRLNLAKVARRSSPPQSGPSARISLQRLAVDDGTLEFRDRSLENPFAVSVAELSGAISGFSTIAGRPPARVELEGRVPDYGRARIRGAIDLESPKSLTDVRAELRNLDVTELNPYTVQFAGYRVNAGRLDADLRYRVRESRLVGDNRLLLRQIELGERVRPDVLKDVPIDLALALLKDPQGRIDVGIPVHGDLSDPKFDIGKLLVEAAANSLKKIVSAPFRALAGALGAGKGKAAQAEVVFDAGAAELTPPAQENIDRVARALADRHDLALTVHGAYAPRADPPALKRLSVRRELAHRAGYDVASAGGPEAVDPRDPKIVRAAERLFLEQGGSRDELAQLRAGDNYGQALFRRLVAHTAVSEDTEKALAQARAEMVRAALVMRGIPPARVRIGPPAQAKSSKMGVPIELALALAGEDGAKLSAR